MIDRDLDLASRTGRNSRSLRAGTKGKQLRAHLEDLELRRKERRHENDLMSLKIFDVAQWRKMVGLDRKVHPTDFDMTQVRHHLKTVHTACDVMKNKVKKVKY